MKNLSIKQIIKDGNYYTQIACYSCFLLVSILVLIIELISFDGWNFNGIFQLCFIILLVVVPFGYFLGIKKIIKTSNKINMIKKLNFEIHEKTVIDMTRVNSDSSNRYCQIVFGDSDGIWVSRKKEKEFKIGDICYLFRFKNNEEYFAIYNKKLINLDSKLFSLLKN